MVADLSTNGSNTSEWIPNASVCIIRRLAWSSDRSTIVRSKQRLVTYGRTVQPTLTNFDTELCKISNGWAQIWLSKLHFNQLLKEFIDPSDFGMQIHCLTHKEQHVPSWETPARDVYSIHWPYFAREYDVNQRSATYGRTAEQRSVTYHQI